MMRKPHDLAAGIQADPFDERRRGIPRVRFTLLGAAFEFECADRPLRRLIDWAYADLPPHRLCAPAPRLRVRLVPAPEAPPRSRRERARREPPPVRMCSGSGLLCGAAADASFAIISPPQRSALVVLAREMLRFAYQARYEILELAVFTLAARAQGLVPLHAACVGRGGRGILLMGASGAGKSTAALHCLLRGCELISEDSVFVEPTTLRATGVANFLHLRPQGLRFLPESCAALVRRSPRIRRRSGVAKYEVDVRRHAAFHLAASPLRVRALIFASSRPASRGPLLVPLDHATVAARLEATQPYAAHLPGWNRFKRTLRAAPAFELRRGHHPCEAAAALDALLAAPSEGLLGAPHGSLSPGAGQRRRTRGPQP